MMEIGCRQIHVRVRAHLGRAQHGLGHVENADEADLAQFLLREEEDAATIV